MKEEDNTVTGTGEAAGNENITSDNGIEYRRPEVQDGEAVWSLVKSSGVLDVNSAYCYLLLCDHFRDTCAVAEADGNIVGFVTGYILPADPSTLFVWQVGIDASARGKGIARKLILEVLERNCCRSVTKIQCTISPSNKASLALFKSLAKHLGTGFSTADGYGTALFPGAGHEQEDLVVVGPFNQISR